MHTIECLYCKQWFKTNDKTDVSCSDKCSTDARMMERRIYCD